VIDVNERAESLFQRGREGLVGVHQRDLHPPDMARVHEGIFERHAEGVAPLSTGEAFILRGDGSRLPVEIESGRVGAGERTLVTGVFRDASVRDGDVSAPLRAEVRFRNLVENALVGIYIIEEGRFTYVNPRFTEILGVDRPTLYELPSVLEVIHPADRSTVAQNLARRVRGEIDTLQYRFRGLRGRPPEPGEPDHRDVFQVEVRGTRVPGGPGKQVEIVGMLEDISDRLATQERLERAARYDELTGLYNRHEMNLRLRESLGRARDRGVTDAFVLIDLDQFTSVNDVHGHLAGDALLQDISGVLTSLHLTSVVARLGDDELALLLPDRDDEEAVRDGEAIRLAIRGHATEFAGRRLRVTASIGIARLEPEFSDLSQVLQASHGALRAARRSGGDSVVLFRSESDEAVAHRNEAEWSLRIRDALEEGAFVLYGQPILALQETGREAEGMLPMVEVLVRMRWEGEDVPAARFIPVAERHNLVQRIDRWVIENAWDAYEAHCGAGDSGDVRLSVNVSPRAIEDAVFREELIRMASERPRAAAHTVFEITETIAIRDLDVVRGFAETLHGLGCSFALDDFGSGANSIMYLTLPVTSLKIDGRLIRRIADDEQQRMIVRAYVDIAHRMGLRTVAEGVESAELRQPLLSLGVDEVQGWAVAMPQPLEELCAGPGPWIRAWTPGA
jgi:diguanylate cyclase (GGDEF)-like protein/PAS domain S-box-containing protein